MKRIFQSVFTISVIAVFVVATSAYFSDTETSENNLMVSGAIDLKVGNESYLFMNGVGALVQDLSWSLEDLTDQLFFNFDDIKPGDLGEDTISLYVDNNDAWMCANVRLTETGDPEDTKSEPEVTAGDTTFGPWAGELDEELFFVFWADDGDNVFEVNETVLMSGPASNLPQGDENLGLGLPLAVPGFNAFGDEGPMLGATEYHIGKAWCFGEMTPAPLADDSDDGPLDRGPGFVCNGRNVTNLSQSDTVKGTVTFYAEQARNNPDFVCPICQGASLYASDDYDVAQGKRKNGTNVPPERSTPANAFGASDGVFFSLGFGGQISLAFDYPVVNVPGNDLTIYEVTNSRASYPQENADVYVSQDGDDWEMVASITSATETSQVEITPSGYSWIRYVRLVDTTDASIHEPTADGFDLNAVKAEAHNTCIMPMAN